MELNYIVSSSCSADENLFAAASTQDIFSFQRRRNLFITFTVGHKRGASLRTPLLVTLIPACYYNYIRKPLAKQTCIFEAQSKKKEM